MLSYIAEISGYRNIVYTGVSLVLANEERLISTVCYVFLAISACVSQDISDIFRYVDSAFTIRYLVLSYIETLIQM